MSRVFDLPPSSSGLGHWPFKPEAGVRIPLGAPNKRWERSSVGERLPYKQEVVGSSPAAPTRVRNHRYLMCGQVAQLVEHWTENPGVGGSIPPLATRINFWGLLPPFLLILINHPSGLRPRCPKRVGSGE